MTTCETLYYVLVLMRIKCVYMHVNLLLPSVKHVNCASTSCYKALIYDGMSTFPPIHFNFRREEHIVYFLYCFKSRVLLLQWNFRIKDTLGAWLLSLVQRLSSGGRFDSICYSRALKYLLNMYLSIKHISIYQAYMTVCCQKC